MSATPAPEPFGVRDELPDFFWLQTDLYDHFSRRVGAVGLAVYTALCRYRNRATGRCWPSLTRLEWELDLTRKTLKKYLARLEAFGLIAIETQTFERDGKRWEGYVFTLRRVPSKPTLTMGGTQSHPYTDVPVGPGSQDGCENLPIEPDLCEPDLAAPEDTRARDAEPPPVAVSPVPPADGIGSPPASSSLSQGAAKKQAPASVTAPPAASSPAPSVRDRPPGCEHLPQPPNELETEWERTFPDEAVRDAWWEVGRRRLAQQKGYKVLGDFPPSIKTEALAVYAAYRAELVRQGQHVNGHALAPPAEGVRFPWETLNDG